MTHSLAEFRANHDASRPGLGNPSRTFGPRARRARVGQRSLAGVFRSPADRSWVSGLIEKRSGARLHVLKHGGFEGQRTPPVLRETLAPLETLCAYQRCKGG
jgi:hypothetical protein